MANEIVVNSDIVNSLSPEQFSEFISELRDNRNIPHKFSYITPISTDFWDTFYTRNLDSETYTTPQATLQLLENSHKILDYLTQDKELHVLDIGPGNGYPLKATLEKLSKDSDLKSYTAFDFSAAFNQLALNNMATWISDIGFRNIEGDFESFDFGSILETQDTAANIVYLLGGTLSNIEHRGNVLKKLIASLGTDDLFVVNFTLEEGSQKIVYGTMDFIFEGYIPKEIGIDLEASETKVFFEESTKRFLATITLDKDYHLRFKRDSRQEHVELKQGDVITVWMHLISSFQDIIKLIENSGGTVFSATKSLDETQGIFFVKRKAE